MAEIDDQELEALQQRAAAADSAAAAAEAAQTDAAAMREALSGATVRYADAVRAANADIPADTIAGDTFDAIDAAAATARTIADAVRQAQPPAPAPAPAVPAGGAPTRDATPNVEGMSAAEKIRLGIQLRTRQP